LSAITLAFGGAARAQEGAAVEPTEPAPAPEAPSQSPPPAPEAASVPPALATEAPAAPAPAPPTVEAEKKATPVAGWKDGFFVASEDGAYKLKIGGYLHADSRWFVDDEDEKLADQFTFRRMRLDLGGTLAKILEFRFLPDFAGGRIVVQDAWVDLGLHPAFRLRVGKFKAPFGLERLQSATALGFVERGFPTNLAPNRDVGVQLWGDVAGGLVSWAAGVFDGVADGASTDGDVTDDKEVAGRLFVQPFAPGKGLLKNVGAGAAVTAGDKQGTFASPEVSPYKTTGQATFFTPVLGMDQATTVIASGAHVRVTGQGYAYVGPVGFLGEYARSSYEVALGDVEGKIIAQAWNAELFFVLTGEDASYKGVTPDHPLDLGDGTWGAFELAARFHQLTIGDRTFDHGFADPAKSARQARAFGGGLRWHATRSLRVYLDAEGTGFEGGASGGGDRPTELVILTRLQTLF